MLLCKFCDKETKNNNAKAQHELYCKSNPDAKQKVPSYGMRGKGGQGIASNQHIKGTSKGLSDEGRKRISESTKNMNLVRWSNPQNRLKHALKMRDVARSNPDSYSSSNRGRVKQIEHDGIKFQGKWELDFYIWCTNNNIKCIRNCEGFSYSWNGNRTYFPDFFLPEYNTYVEVKGYKTDRDEAKCNQFPKNILIISATEIRKIREGSYSLLKSEDNSIG